MSSNGFHWFPAPRSWFGRGRAERADAAHVPTATNSAVAAIEREHRLVRIYFGIGLAASGILGSVALLVVLSLAAGPGADRWNWFSGQSQPSAWGLYDALPRPDRTGGPLANPDLVTLDFSIPDRERGGAPLSLQRKDRAWLRPDTAALVLRNVPQTVAFSRGTRDAAGVWRLQSADLPFLYIVVPRGAPAAFDIAVDTLDKSGTARTAAIARIRLQAEPADALARQPGAALRPDQAQRPAAVVRDATGVLEPERPRSTQQPQAQRALPAARQPAARPAESAPAARNPANAPYPAYTPGPRVDLPRPNGMSGLGGPGRETETGASTDWWRVLWWRLPAATAAAQPVTPR